MKKLFTVLVGLILILHCPIFAMAVTEEQAPINASTIDLSIYTQEELIALQARIFEEMSSRRNGSFYDSNELAYVETEWGNYFFGVTKATVLPETFLRGAVYQITWECQNESFKTSTGSVLGIGGNDLTVSDSNGYIVSPMQAGYEGDWMNYDTTVAPGKKCISSFTYVINDPSCEYLDVCLSSRNINYRVYIDSETTAISETEPTTTIASEEDFIFVNNGSAVQINAYCGQGGRVVIPDKIEGVAVTRIADNAFEDASNITGVVLPEDLQYIGDNAFCFLENLTGVLVIPETVTEVGSHAFQGTSLTGLVIKSSCKLNVNAFANIGSLVFIYVEDGCSPQVGKSVFSYAESLETVVFPNSMTEISDETFKACNKMVIYTPSASFAEEYANQNFIRVNSEEYLTQVKNYSEIYETSVSADEISFETQASEEDDLVGEAVQYPTDYGISVSKCTWEMNDGFYSPVIKVDVKNDTGTSAKKIELQVVFYNDDEKMVWDDRSTYLISSSDAPLKNGYSKTAMLRSTWGYQKFQDSKYLPNLSYEIYINGTLYFDGFVEKPGNSIEIQTAISAAKELKSLLKNPSSIRLHAAYLEKSETNPSVVLEISAQNGFGGLDRKCYLCTMDGSTCLTCDEYEYFLFERSNYKELDVSLIAPSVEE